MRIKTLIAAATLAAAGCGAKGDGLKPGDLAVIVRRDAEVNNEAFSKGVAGGVRVLLDDPSRMVVIPDGARAIVLENKDPESENYGKPIRIRIDDGEFNGKTCSLARCFLERLNSR